ncbi:hypothetical protein BKA70DRAFT_1556138 [Coprinopsis sp. MPI-PUGE-AT-0042]|nr:hypothetical protein BKA70DRAFT_1556138 [Coprinopsis sp. MPI-PUGE-AT-0042]
MAATQGLPAHFFDALRQGMSSKEGILCFLGQLDPSLPYKKPEQILWDLINDKSTIQRCLELILSSSPWADALGSWLQRTFPSPLPTPAADCIHTTVLSSVTNYIFFSNLQLAGCDDQASVQHDMIFASHAPGAIEKLSTMKFFEKAEYNAEDGESTVKIIRKKANQLEGKKQRQAEARRKKQTKLEEEAEVFRALGGLSVPDTPQEAQALIAQLTLELKNLLVKYLAILRMGSVSETLLSSFVAEAEPHSAKERTRPESIVTDVQSPDIVSPIALSAFEKPLKAALYFDSADDLGDWEVFLSNKAIRDIRSAQRRDQSLYEIIMKKIKELSHSQFAGDNQKVLVGGDNAIPVFEAKMTGDCRLVYQIDCLPDYSGERERQVIRIFGVFTHTQLNRVWESLGYQLAHMGGREHRDRCCKRLYNREGTRIVPAVFPPNRMARVDPVPIPELPKEDLEEIHSILVLEKFVNFSKELRNSLIAELDVQHVFHLSSQEMEIIEHPSSCYVIGRSGTGKTTTMLFKMLGLERTFSMLGDERSAKPRQLFVTKSPVLATRVEDYFARLMASLKVGQMSESELRELAKNAPHGAFDAPKSMVHKKDMRWKVGLPTRFSLLQEHHFPLFLTFDRLAEMIIGDVLAPDNSWLNDKLEALDTGDVSKMNSLIRILTSSKDVLRYPTFLEDYWDHFPQGLVRGLDPALVFSEIIGVIKGAEESITCKGRYLDKATYLALSDRTNYLFASQRERIYELFVKYGRLKRELGGIDAADRTHAILEVFNLIGVPGLRVDFLYVDEAQDNMLIDAMLLRSICKNPCGLFWAGDTAQTISIGNSFRFQDLKAFLYRLEERRAQQLIDAATSANQQPASFTLAVNYRSHGGIIACAHSVVEILTRFWPTSLDKMAPEKGEVDGDKPLFLANNNVGTLRFRDFMTGGESNIEFGAAQCILVRDEAARDKFVDEIGDIGIVMTLYDSKGLEFDDVLLYQFFEDSTLDLSRWRVLLNLLPGQMAPKFDDVRHAGLCSEGKLLLGLPLEQRQLMSSQLKFLYVAITRARKKLWVYDSSNKAHPLQTVWESLKLIENFKPESQQQLPQFASASSRQEWQEAAERLFDNENYYEAVVAFKRAGSVQQAKIAEAYQQRKEAELTVTKPKRKKLFKVAANLFTQCAQTSLENTDKKAFHGIAGLCWSQVGDYAEATVAYLVAEEYDNGLQMCRKGGMFDQGVQIIKGHEVNIKDKTALDDFKDVAKLFYLKDKELRQVLLMAKAPEEMLVYLKDNTFLDESRALLLEKMGRTMMAADVHLEEGRLLEAIRVLLSNEEDQSSTARGHDLIVQALWKAMSFGNLKNRGAMETKKLLQWASSFTGPLRDEVAMFLDVDCSDWTQTRVLGRRLLQSPTDHTAALLCFSYVLHPTNLPNIRRWSNTELAEILSDCLCFCSLLRYHADNLDVRSEDTQRLFNFHPTRVENTYTIPPGSWLYTHLKGRALSSERHVHDSSNILMASITLRERLKDGILAFIAAVIDHENKQCQAAAALTPCLEFILTDDCLSSEDCSGHHLRLSDLTHQWITTQVRVHFQQIILCQMKDSIPKHLGGGCRDKRYWIRRLYHTFNQPVAALGSWSCVKFGAIPESQRASGVVRSWCRDILDDKVKGRDGGELSMIYQAADLCFHLDKQDAGKYVHSSKLVDRLRKESAFIRKGGAYTIPDLLGSLDASHPWFLKGGLAFARHVLDSRLPIDANVLCTFMEFLTSAFLVAYGGFRFHNITLPRKQILHLYRRLRPGLRPDLRYFAMGLLKGWGRILKVLVMRENAAWLLFNGYEGPLSMRRLFVPRVCQAMCLVGHNIPHEPLHNTIMQMMEPLILADYSPLYRSFALARSWKDLEEALWEPSKVSVLDDMVKLWSANTQQPMPAPPKGVTCIAFSKIEEISQLLTKSLPAVTVPEVPYLPAVSAAKPKVDATAAPSARSQQLAAEDQRGTETAMEVALEDNADSGTSQPALTVNMAPIEEAVITSQQLEGAEKICQAYKAWVRRRRLENSRPRREVACRTFYDACLKETGSVEWPRTGQTPGYQKLYLGVVPHLLVVIQWVQIYVAQEKPAAKRSLKAAKGINFEKGMERMVRINIISQTLDKLHKALQPQSVFHAKRDVKALHKIVSEAEEIFRRLPKAQSGEVEFDMHMAKPPTKKLQVPPFHWDREKKQYTYDEVNEEVDYQDWE